MTIVIPGSTPQSLHGRHGHVVNVVNVVTIFDPTRWSLQMIDLESLGKLMKTAVFGRLYAVLDIYR